MQPPPITLPPAASPSLTLLLCLLACLSSQIIQKAIAAAANSMVPPAVPPFGDSTVDAGDNNYFPTLARSNVPPYGRDFMGGIPTGRFTNGKVPSDLLVEALGIKELVPPYLDPNLSMQDLLTGMRFLSSDSIAFSVKNFCVRNDQMAMTLLKQLKLLEEYIEKLKGEIGEERTKSIVSESLYMLCFGGNDIVVYFATPLRRSQYDISSYTDILLLNELYRLGAWRIVVYSIPPVGCIPSQRTIGGGETRLCEEKHNQAAMLFNSKLSSQLNLLNNKLPQAMPLYTDIYNSTLDLIQNPHTHGFEEATKGCCGTGTIEVTNILCNGNPFTCTYTSEYVFWDSYHPTEKTFRIILTPILKYLYSLF
ncbi:hypothetical protein NE237_016997 [Protea cynaroides]|uniref:GDSL esterase/lipase n=1 Tax=Protea cynaroides TaxID=273540 RepID=A0A9Q0K772_9MAGN|nr:hypothetical protein NE237_016997 [Protea cynaroides]